MTYDAHEVSLQSGEPLELYQFSCGTNVYRFTSAKQNVVIGSNTFEAAVLRRNSIDFSAEKGRNSLKIDATRQFVVADLFRITPPSDMVLLTVYRVHVEDAEVVVIWSGRVLSVDFGSSTATITCEPVTTSLKRTGLRRLYQRQCPHVLYGSACKVNKASFTVPVTLSSVIGTTLNSAAIGLYPDEYFSGGYIDVLIDGVIERRFITTHTGTQITINIPLAGLGAGSSITLYAGCDHTTTTCTNKFSNLDNYGGMPYIPQKNPFGTNGIY